MRRQHRRGALPAPGAAWLPEKQRKVRARRPSIRSTLPQQRPTKKQPPRRLADQHLGRFVYKSKLSCIGGTSAPSASSPSSSSSRADQPRTPYFAVILSKKRARPSRYFSPA